MSQIIEGVDNEVTLTFTFLTVAAAIVIPWYFMRPRRAQRVTVNNVSNGTRGNTTQESSESTTDNQIHSTQESTPAQPLRDVTGSNQTPTDNIHRTSTPSQPIGFRPEFLPQQSPILEQSNDIPAATGQLINVRVKLISDTERPFQVSESTLLSDFKRLCFPDEFTEGKQIRFIYSGRILQPDTETLQHFRIGDGCVVHAQISQRQNNTSSSPTSTIPDDLDLSSCLVPILTFALTLGWLAIFTFDGIFTWTSILILGFLTIMMLVTSWL